MTKRDRLEEIEDFSEYLSGLYASFETQLPQDCVKSILAFSQGVQRLLDGYMLEPLR